MPASPWGLWFEPNMILGSMKTTVKQTGYSYTLGGFTLGVDYRVMDSLLLGLATGYNYTDTGFQGSGGGMKNNTWPLTAYGFFNPNSFYAFGSVGYQLNLFDQQRQIVFPAINRTAESSTTGHQINAYGEMGYDLKLKPVVLTPVVSLGYSGVWINGFTESGAGALNLNVDKQNANSLQTGVGSKVSVPFKRGDTTIVPQVYAIYQHEFSNNSRGLNARLSAPPSVTMTWQTEAPDRDFAVLGGNVTVGIKKNLAAQVNYNAEVGRSLTTNHFINLGVRYQF
jgi:outer membrane lipase/esterase